MAVQSPLPQGGVSEIVVTSVFLLFAIIAVCMRLYSRKIQKKALWLDDYFIIASLTFTTATVGVGYALVFNGGVGLHMVDASLKQIQISLKLFVPAPLLWALSTSFLKLSILFFYISIFTIPNIRIAVYAVIGLTSALIVAVIFESFLLCRPFVFTWDKSIEGGVCGDSTKAYLAIAITNLIVDVSLVFIPMPVLWALQLPIRKKIIISAILGFGLVICTLTAVRIKSVLDLASGDFTYHVVPDLIFGALEIELGIVNACLPILGPLITKLFRPDPTPSKQWINKSSNYNHTRPTTFGKKQVTSDNNFELLPDDADSLGGEQVPHSSLHRAQSRAHIESLPDLESGHQTRSGGIVVRSDFSIYRTATQNPSLPQEVHEIHSTR
ncbi:hypothetical protein F4808DRAFT_447285 [Astrocystis sublimbata]|nr:hypothetical protein F4808DRAFT_447285 [Astrocystis sublimbata]